MAKYYDHLIITPDPSIYKRKARLPLFYKEQRTDKKHFMDVQVRSFDNLKKDFEKYKTRFPKFLNPKLIFKVKVNQAISEKKFRTDLAKAGVQIISSSPDDSSYWIAFAEKANFNQFKEQLDNYFAGNKPTVFSAIEKLSNLSPEDKIGELLKEKPFGIKEIANLDIEIWRMNDKELDAFFVDLETLVDENRCDIIDRLTTQNFCIIRIRANKALYDAMIEVKEIAHIDRPPKIQIDNLLNESSENYTLKEPPPKNATGILLIDSGLLSGHPLLKNAVADQILVRNKKIAIDTVHDDVGHGTKVAGAALYGDVESCILNHKFEQNVWIYSAKVMYRNSRGEADYDDQELFEHQLSDALTAILDKYPNCKVVNLSLGSSKHIMYPGKRQFVLASLLDEKAKEYSKAVFVVASGNYERSTLDNYPDYLLKDRTDAKIIDPASAALALTTGAVYRKFKTGTMDSVFYPSPLTTTGPGYKGMIKPELVENGGGGLSISKGQQDDESGVITLNPNFVKEGKRFTTESGTSMSAAKVSHFVAKVFNKYPDASANLVKALLLSSATIPEDRPEKMSELKFQQSKDAFDLLKIYGYGIPNVQKALFSEQNRVLLISDAQIKPGTIHYYPLFLPKEFVEFRGRRMISVSLVFNPPVNKNSPNYLGTTMEFRLFKNKAIYEIDELYRKIKEKEEEVNETAEENGEDEDEEELSDYATDLRPGLNLRKKGVHQKGIKVFQRGNPDIDINKPLVLAISCQNKGWIEDKNYVQSYAVVVAIEHALQVDLYDKIRTRNQQRVRLRS